MYVLGETFLSFDKINHYELSVKKKLLFSKIYHVIQCIRYIGAVIVLVSF